MEIKCPVTRQVICQPLLAFSLFDVFSFPQLAQALSTYDNSIITRVERLSPDSSSVLFPNARAKIKQDGLVSFSRVFLRSTDLAHFAGFLHRSYREFDILWGRLDGAEAMCRVLSNAVKEEIYREQRDTNNMVREMNNLQNLRNTSLPPAATEKPSDANLNAVFPQQSECRKVLKEKKPLDSPNCDPTNLSLFSCLALQAVLNEMASENAGSLTNTTGQDLHTTGDLEMGMADARENNKEEFFQAPENKEFVRRLKGEVDNELAKILERTNGVTSQ